MSLKTKVAVVTGATRGVGRGVARELGRQGAQVFITGRSVPDHEPFEEPAKELRPLISPRNPWLVDSLSAARSARLGPLCEAQRVRNSHNEAHSGPITAIRCDHREDGQVDAAFERITREAGTVDILVNSVWGGYEGMVENGEFTWPRPFWEQPLWRWDAMFAAGVRAYYHASQLAARTMVAQRHGLIVHISFWAAQKHIGNVAYGVSKAATDKMTMDMGVELKRHGVAVVSLYPGLVRTEKVMEAAPYLDLSNSESPDFIGRAVAALAADPEVLRHTGKALVAAELAREYGFTDVDGKSPRPLTLADV